MEYHLQSSVIHSIDDEEVCYITHCDSRSSKYIAAVGSNNIIKLYDQQTHAIVSVLKGHTDTIHQATFINDTTLISCSSDRSIRIFNCDTATQTKSINQKEEVFSFDISGDIMAAAVGSTITIIDTKTWKPVRCFDSCHTEDVTKVMFHPNVPNKILSCSMDGLICLVDLSIQDDDDAIINVMNGEHSVSTFGFFGEQNQYLWSLATTERLSIWNLEDASRIREYGDLRTIISEKNQLEVNYFIVCHYDRPTNNLYLFGGDFSGTGIIFQVKDDQVLPIARLLNGHSELIRTMTWNKEKDQLMTTGEDGRLCFWINQHEFKNEMQQSPSTRVQSKIVKSSNARDKSNPY